MSNVISHAWQPINDLPDDYNRLASDDLVGLSAVWQEQRDELMALDAFKEFNERLKREWAIETGALERLYTLDRGITQLLIERGIEASLIPHGATDKPTELVVAMIRDQQAAIEGLFAFVRGDRDFSTSYIRELHAVLTRHQSSTTAVDAKGRQVLIPLRHGDWKQHPNNPTRPDGSIHEYCPPEHVASEMDRLVEMHHQHQEVDIRPEVETAWLHHRFTQIHPFQDGNGRVARCLATLVLLKAGWLPLVVTRDHREEYIAGLEDADRGDLAPLIGFFARNQIQALIRAIAVAAEAQRSQRLQQVIESAANALLRRHESLKDEWESAKRMATELVAVAVDEVKGIADEVSLMIRDFVPGNPAWVDHELDGGDRGHYFNYQIIQTAKALGYFANTHLYHSWVRLKLQTGQESEIIVSFHVPGREYRGLLVCTATSFGWESTDQEDRQIGTVTPSCKELFQFGYKEEPADVERRFRRWLEDSMLMGLEFWESSL